MLIIQIDKKTFESHYIGCKNLAEIFLKKVPIAFVQIGSSIRIWERKISTKRKRLVAIQNQSMVKLNCYPRSYLINLFKKQKFPSTVLRLYQYIWTNDKI